MFGGHAWEGRRMKTSIDKPIGEVQRRSAATARPEREDGSAGLAVARGWSPQVDGSERMLVQRQQLQDMVGPVPEEEELPVQAKADEPRPNGLPGDLKAGIESLSGMDMSGVTVHRNSSQPAQLNALAYAQGNDIHLAPGQDQHLAHEAWHVVQQRQGRVRPTMQLQGVSVNDDESLEKEADAMGDRAAQFKPAR
jgi:hypothetical protein